MKLGPVVQLLSILLLSGFINLVPAQVAAKAAAQPAPPPPPWMNTALDADARADLMIHEMTMDEKIQLVHGDGWGVLRKGAPVAPRHNGGAGFVPGIPRLNLPDINLADSAVGVRMAALQSRYATLLPSVIGLAASWDPDAAYLYGQVIGRELRAQGFNMSIGGGMDLIREPRNGRNFEYASEDPILAGNIVGQIARGVQSNEVMGDIKHYAFNDQETGRNTLNVVLDRRAMRETDLLAFQIAVSLAKPAGVMCSYNRVNGDYSCENDYLLNQVLKNDFGFKGFVLSDWDGTHSTVKAALAGLDMQQPGAEYFGVALEQAVKDGQVPESRLDDMVHRIVRSMIANGVVDHPPVRSVVDPFRGRDDAKKIEEESLVLLRNEGGMLPLSSERKYKIAIIGAHADVAVLSGGGSAQVDAPGGNTIAPYSGPSHWGEPVYFPSSPMENIRALSVPGSTLTYNEGKDPAQAAKVAASADITILFVEQWMIEGQDAPTLSLPNHQDTLVDAVAAANPNTIVILETGGPVTMPWAGKVKSIIEAWYPGIGGGQAIADVLFGKVSPSGKLPVTFAAADTDLAHPQVTGLTQTTTNNAMNIAGNGYHQQRNFTVDYNVEGMMVGYKWFQAKNKTPLYQFGFGLSYRKFAYSHLRVEPDGSKVRFELSNIGSKAGDEVAEVYVTLPDSDGEPFRKLAGWRRVSLAAGASQKVEIAINPLYLSIFSVDDNGWKLAAGDYTIEVGPSSATLPLHGKVSVAADKAVTPSFQ
jgi:beta-glucosidase